MNPTLLSLMMEAPSLNQFATLVKETPSLLVEGLWEGAKGALISLIASATQKHILVISSSDEDRLMGDLTYFSPSHTIEFPSWETLPGEEIPPSPDLVGKRFQVLHSLLHSTKPHIVLSPLQAVLQPVPTPQFLKPRCYEWKLKDQVLFSSLPTLLNYLGYRKTPVVADKCEYALRGGILDLFPPSSQEPYRIDFFGDEIDQIRTFDPISQKSTGKVTHLLLSPATELLPVEKEPSSPSILDYLGPNTIVIFNDLLAIEDRWVSLKTLSNAANISSLTPFDTLLDRIETLPHQFWTKERVESLSKVQITKRIGRGFYSGKNPLQSLSFEWLDHSFSTSRWHHPFVQIADYFSLSENHASATEEEILHSLHRHAESPMPVWFVCATEAEKLSFENKVQSLHLCLPPTHSFDFGYLSSGFVIEDSQFTLLPMTEMTHRLRPRRQKWRTSYHTPASEFHALGTGDVVVHFHHGISKYLGTEVKPNHAGVPTEFMLLEYAEGSKLFVPVSQSHLVSRYIGAKEEIPTLSQLGSNRWQKTRTSAQQAIIGYADQLLRMSAERTVHGGFSFAPDSKEMTLFEEDFPFVPTQDQLRAIETIKEEMESTKAMDRLICGDVGYGKTEVAMRAAFKAVVDGKKQVAVLVPTTILAMQHYENFCERMANFPIQIGVLSRFRTQKEMKETLKQTAEGTLDILIGTHRIISQDVRFKDLGLVIIDEEQRFGVRAKEHLKKIKTGVDCLTLSATPIPRTLYLSMVGAKEISLINTPPQDRLPIKTILADRELPLIHNALLRELSRGGQAYFIHNRVETIFRVTEEIQQLLPEANIVTGHGQMSSEELDAVFHAFKSGAADILVATTIIENGIDIPNANTILIDKAHTFGLADLYQMRGRVGRWNKPAYAYLLVPKLRELPEITRLRLHALAESSGFGGGIKVAMRDLEIRGAGDILGTQQSGQISSIGFHLYCKLLKKAVDALKHNTSPSFTETKLEFPFNASLPEIYINESTLRMEIYHRLGEASSLTEIDTILEELKDRFGPCPQEVLWLYHLTRLRLFASIHHFTLLKMENYTFTAERQRGKILEKKTLPLPKTKDPKQFEPALTQLLTEHFLSQRRNTTK